MYSINISDGMNCGWTLHYDTIEEALKEWDDIVEHGKEGDKLILSRTSEMIIGTATAKGKEYV